MAAGTLEKVNGYNRITIPGCEHELNMAENVHGASQLHITQYKSISILTLTALTPMEYGTMVLIITHPASRKVHLYKTV